MRIRIQQLALAALKLLRRLIGMRFLQLQNFRKQFLLKLQDLAGSSGGVRHDIPASSGVLIFKDAAAIVSVLCVSVCREYAETESCCLKRKAIPNDLFIKLFLYAEGRAKVGENQGCSPDRQSIACFVLNTVDLWRISTPVTFKLGQ